MTTITPRLAVAGRATVAIGQHFIRAAGATAPDHVLLAPAILAMIAAIIIFRLIVRVNTELAGLLTQMIRTMATLGRAAIAILVTVGLAAILLLHL